MCMFFCSVVFAVYRRYNQMWTGEQSPLTKGFFFSDLFWFVLWYPMSTAVPLSWVSGYKIIASTGSNVLSIIDLDSPFQSDTFWTWIQFKTLVSLLQLISLIDSLILKYQAQRSVNAKIKVILCFGVRRATHLVCPVGSAAVIVLSRMTSFTQWDTLDIQLFRESLKGQSHLSKSIPCVCACVCVCVCVCSCSVTLGLSAS